jgi:hypothetical protein
MINESDAVPFMLVKTKVAVRILRNSTYQFTNVLLRYEYPRYLAISNFKNTFTPELELM